MEENTSKLVQFSTLTQDHTFTNILDKFNMLDQPLSVWSTELFHDAYDIMLLNILPTTEYSQKVPTNLNMTFNVNRPPAWMRIVRGESQYPIPNSSVIVEILKTSLKSLLLMLMVLIGCRHDLQ